MANKKIEVRNRSPKDHPVFICFAMVAAGISGTAAFLYTYYDKQVALVKDQYEFELKQIRYSIDRGIGKEGFIDVQKVLVPTSFGDPPKDSTYVDAGFYAAMQVPGLKYSQTTFENFLLKQYKGNMPSDILPLAGLLHIGRVHLWEGEPTFDIQAVNEDFIIRPYIALQKTPLRKLRVALGRIGLSLFHDSLSNLKEGKEDMDEQQRAEFVRRLETVAA